MLYESKNCGNSTTSGRKTFALGLELRCLRCGHGNRVSVNLAGPRKSYSTAFGRTMKKVAFGSWCNATILKKADLQVGFSLPLKPGAPPPGAPEIKNSPLPISYLLLKTRLLLVELSD